MSVRKLSLALAAAMLCLLGAASASASPIASSAYAWRLAAVPGPDGAPVGAMYPSPDLACPTANWCVLLTDLQYLTTLSGGTATTVDAPVYSTDPYAEGGLVSVACARVGDCVATGSWAEGPWDSPAGYRYELSGGQWRPENGTPAWMDTSCNVDRCVEMATEDVGVDRGVVDDRVTGGSWVNRPVTTPWQSDGLFVDLTALDCPPSGPCYGLGGTQDTQYQPHSLFFSRAGNAWHGVPAAGPNGEDTTSQLSALSCPAVRSCIALGTEQDSDGAQLFVLQLRRGALTATPAPLPGVTSAQRMNVDALSCATMTACAAVVSWQDQQGTWHSTLLRYDGDAWSARALFAPASGTSPYVEAISCASAIRCEAVGSYTVHVDGHAYTRPAAWTWFPPGWTVQGLGYPHGTDGHADGWLSDVQCRSDDRCVAVGAYDPYGDNSESVYAVGRLSG